MYIVGDLIAGELATLLFNVVRHLWLNAGTGITFSHWSEDLPVELSYLAFPAVMLSTFGLLGFYNDPRYKSRYEVATNDALGAVIGSLIIYFAIMVNDNFSERSLHYGLLLVLWVGFFVTVLLARYAVRAILLAKASRGEDTYNVIVVGPSVDMATDYAGRLDVSYTHLNLPTT